MTSIIKLHAVSGAMNESPPCYILQVDELRILLDCGWDENFDQDFIKELKRHVHQIDAVLLSYPDPLHLGALPYLIGKCGLNWLIPFTLPYLSTKWHEAGKVILEGCISEDYYKVRELPSEK